MDNIDPKAFSLILSVDKNYLHDHKDPIGLASYLVENIDLIEGDVRDRVELFIRTVEIAQDIHAYIKNYVSDSNYKNERISSDSIRYARKLIYLHDISLVAIDVHPNLAGIELSEGQFLSGTLDALSELRTDVPGDEESLVNEMDRKFIEYLIAKNKIKFRNEDSLEEELLAGIGAGMIQTKEDLYKFSLLNKSWMASSEFTILTCREYIEQEFALSNPMMFSPRALTSIYGEYLDTLDNVHDYTNYFSDRFKHLNTEEWCWVVASIESVKRIRYFEEAERLAFSLRIYKEIRKAVFKEEISIPILKDIVELTSMEVYEAYDLVTSPPLSLGVEIECILNGIWLTGEITKDEVLEYAYLKKYANRSGFAKNIIDALSQKIDKAIDRYSECEDTLTIFGMRWDNLQTNKSRPVHEFSIPPVKHPKILRMILTDLIELDYLDLSPENLLFLGQTIDVNWGTNRHMRSQKDYAAIQIAFIASGLMGNGLKGAGAREVANNGYDNDGLAQFNSKLIRLRGGKDFMHDEKRTNIFGDPTTVVTMEGKAMEINSFDLFIQGIEHMFGIVPLCIEYDHLSMADKFLLDEINESEFSLDDIDTLYYHSRKLTSEQKNGLKWIYFKNNLIKIFEKHDLKNPFSGYDSLEFELKGEERSVRTSVDFTILEERIMEEFDIANSDGSIKEDALVRLQNPPVGGFAYELRQLFAKFTPQFSSPGEA